MARRHGNDESRTAKANTSSISAAPFPSTAWRSILREREFDRARRRCSPRASASEPWQSVARPSSIGCGSAGGEVMSAPFPVAVPCAALLAASRRSASRRARGAAAAAARRMAAAGDRVRRARRGAVHARVRQIRRRRRARCRSRRWSPDTTARRTPAGNGARSRARAPDGPRRRRSAAQATGRQAVGAVGGARSRRGGARVDGVAAVAARWRPRLPTERHAQRRRTR